MTGLLITRAEWGARPARGGIGTIAPEGITVHYNVDDVVRADIRLCPAWQGQISALGEFYMAHPLTGKTTMIKRIEFGDGSAFEC